MLADSLCQSLPLTFPPSAPVNIRHQNMIVLMLKVSRKAHKLGCIHPPIELSHTLVCEVRPGFCYTEGCRNPRSVVKREGLPSDRTKHETGVPSTPELKKPIAEIKTIEKRSSWSTSKSGPHPPGSPAGHQFFNFSKWHPYPFILSGQNLGCILDSSWFIPDSSKDLSSYFLSCSPSVIRAQTLPWFIHRIWIQPLLPTTVTPPSKSPVHFPPKLVQKPLK